MWLMLTFSKKRALSKPKSRVNKMGANAMIILITIIISSCTNPPKNQAPPPPSYADSLWIAFAEAMEAKDLDYLRENSLDTIQCVDCVVDHPGEDDYFVADGIFQYYLPQLMHLDSLTDRVFTTHMSDSIIHVSYSIEWALAPEGGYNLVFTFRKKDDQFWFAGMFTVP